jgi:hypothetical protein
MSYMSDLHLQQMEADAEHLWRRDRDPVYRITEEQQAIWDRQDARQAEWEAARKAAWKDRKGTVLCPRCGGDLNSPLHDAFC